MTHIQRIRTELLEVAYEAGGPAEGPAILLLHGWPDDVRTFDAVAAELHRLGCRTYAPYLRGFGETRFLSAATPRSGQIAAMAQDVLDLADALHLERFAIVGHDWGARIGYFLAALHPGRVERLVAMSVGWEPGGLRTPALEQARRFWYQWFMATERGAEVVRRDGVAFARFQWQTWSPPTWFDEAVFAVTAPAFQNPDWPEITIHSSSPLGASRSRPSLCPVGEQTASGRHDCRADAGHSRRGRPMRLGGHVGGQGVVLHRRVRSSCPPRHRAFPDPRVRR